MAHGFLILTIICSLISAAPAAHAAFNVDRGCRVISRMIAPCVGFLSGRVLAPYGPCCNGVTALNLTAKTYEARVGICSCIKGLIPRLPILDFAQATALPTLCGLNLNLTVSPSTDCSSLPPP